MDYGELTVHMPDGTVEQYILENNITAIGRQAGNDLVLSTSSASRYHAHIAIEGDSVKLVDLGTVNGTFVNDELMEPDSFIILTGGEEIRIGDVRMVYIAPASAEETLSDETKKSAVPSPLLNPKEDTAKMEHIALALFAQLEEPQQTVAPGSRMQIILNVENRTDVTGVYDLELTGIDPAWVKSTQHQFRLPARASAEVYIIIYPPRSSDIKPGTYDLTVTVTPRGDPSQAITDRTTIEVVPFHGLGMVVRSSENHPGQFSAHVQNQGNVTTSLQLGGWHAQQALTYEFDTSRLTLEPGETRRVKVKVGTARSKKPDLPTTFAIVARSLDPSGYQAAVTAQFTGDSGSGGAAAWIMGLTLPVLILIGGAILAVAAGLYFFGGDLMTSLRPEPTLTPTVPPPAATATVTLPPSPTPYPPPDGVSATFSPAEIIRYQDVDINIVYTITTDLDPDQLNIELFDEVNLTSLRQFTVASAEGQASLQSILGLQWAEFLYQPGLTHRYSLRVRAGDSAPAVSPPIHLTVYDLNCQVAFARPSRGGPGDAYPVAGEILNPISSYQPVAQTQTNDVIWYELRPGGLSVWIQADALTCLREDGEPLPEGFTLVEASSIPPLPQ